MSYQKPRHLLHFWQADILLVPPLQAFEWEEVRLARPNSALNLISVAASVGLLLWSLGKLLESQFRRTWLNCQHSLGRMIAIIIASNQYESNSEDGRWRCAQKGRETADGWWEMPQRNHVGIKNFSASGLAFAANNK